MGVRYRHLGVYSDWPEHELHRRAASPDPRSPHGDDFRQRVLDLLNVQETESGPDDVRIDRRWQGDGVRAEQVSYHVGYGPRTEAWILRPTEAGDAVLPAVIALHCHGGFKYYGKEKIADGPDPPDAHITALRSTLYGGRAYATALAREGFTVMVPDVFLWGSRRFPLDDMPESISEAQADNSPAEGPFVGQDEIGRYNAVARQHEHVIEKYSAVLGTTLAAVVAYEDRVALRYLRSRRDVIADRVGCIGLSGGGCRAALLQATSDDLRAAVIVGMMATYRSLLDAHIVNHSWVFFPSRLARHGDWPDLAACRAPSPLLVQYDLDDHLFPVAGMHEAHDRIDEIYQKAGSAENYEGQFYDGPHKFDLDMQPAAFGWMKERLG